MPSGCVSISTASFSPPIGTYVIILLFCDTLRSFELSFKSWHRLPVICIGSLQKDGLMSVLYDRAVQVLEELHDRDNKNVHIERMRDILSGLRSSIRLRTGTLELAHRNGKRSAAKKSMAAGISVDWAAMSLRD